jgi:decaprenyl-phosphate phosphoribosyltransferase
MSAQPTAGEPVDSLDPQRDRRPGAPPAAPAAPHAGRDERARPSAIAWLSAWLRTLRPKQWIKNLFVAAPLVFARHLGDPAYTLQTALAVLAFCLLSGAVYAFNDVRDAEADRQHPTKRHRPIAARELSEHSALIGSVVLAIGALAACFALSSKLGAIAAVYLAQNVAYTLKLKQIAFVDVAMIASGFILRVLAGAAAIAVPASRWLLLCTALLALFLGFGKRAHELAWAERTGRETATRAALAGYTLRVLKVAMLALAVLTCTAFVAYTVADHTIEFFGTDRLIYSAPFVALGIVRFLFLALWWPKHESPTDAMLRDPWFLLTLVGAATTMLYAIYG